MYSCNSGQVWGEQIYCFYFSQDQVKVTPYFMEGIAVTILHIWNPFETYAKENHLWM